MTPDFARTVALMLPALAVFALHFSQEHTARQRTAALFAGVWVFLFALAVNIGAVAAGAWTFLTTGSALYGVPVDVMLSLGFFAALSAFFCGPRRLGLLFVANMAFMVLFWSPAGGLAAWGDGAFAGFAGMAFLAFLPGLLLAGWTAADTRIYARTFLQSIMWSVLLLWLLPSVALLKAQGSWSVLFERGVVWLLPMLVPAAMIANALYVFAKYGDGTGFPYDPPKRLVTSGLYQYVSNPMQIAICLAMGWWGLVLKSGVVMACAPMAFFLFLVFKDVCNGSSNLCGDDPEWRAYQKRVPRWLPKFYRR